MPDIFQKNLIKIRNREKISLSIKPNEISRHENDYHSFYPLEHTVERKCDNSAIPIYLLLFFILKG